MYLINETICTKTLKRFTEVWVETENLIDILKR